MAVHTQLGKIISSIEKLPPFPQVASRILDLCQDPGADLNEILQVIQYDQAITANCLKLCNSGYFGLQKKVSSLNQAVVMLGLKNILIIVLSNCKCLSSFAAAQEGYGMSRGDLWRHSVTSAIMSQLLLKMANRKDDSVLFTAALLHDVGKLVLDKHIVEDFKSLHALIEEDGLPFVVAEKELFGIDHAEAGGLIAKAWEFPEPLINAIRNHHNGISGKSGPKLEAWVKLSNLVYYVSLIHMYCSQHEGIKCQVDETMLSELGLKQEHIEDIMGLLPVELKKAEGLLKIML